MRKFYFKDLINMAAPIVLGHLGFILIGVGDVIVAGRHSTNTLAAVSLATAIINCIMMFGIGVLSGISALLSNYRGAGKRVERYFYPSIKSAMIMSLVASFVLTACIPAIDYFGFEENLVPLIKDYFVVTAFSTFGAYLHCAVKEYLQAFEIVVFPNVLTVFCIFLNVALNIIFAFGCGVVPEMGVFGLALASLITRYFMGFVLLIYCFRKIKIEHYKDKNYYTDLVKIGMPASLAVMVEFVGFNAVTIILGRISGIYAAAQNIICTITSVSFMIPLAISNAVSVKIGFTNGAKYYKSLKEYAFSAIGMCMAFMSVSAVIAGIFPEYIVKLFTNDEELIRVCIPVVYVLCFFQVFDGLQVALAGIFKGIKQTKIVMLANLTAYWFVSIPLGCFLGLKLKLYLTGFWYSIAISAVVLCTIMLTTLLKKFRKDYGNICRTSL